MSHGIPDPDFDIRQAWPAWKFGLKCQDLTTVLHEKYNTVSFTIQDPEAFHHDVYDISHQASTLDEFYHLMASRKEQRLSELNLSLETVAVKIIANPNLMASDQWPFALQLFRTRSLDSLVRYFSHYIPKSDYNNYSDTPSVSSVDACVNRSNQDTDKLCRYSRDDSLPRVISTSKASLRPHIDIPASPESLPHSDPHEPLSPLDYLDGATLCESQQVRHAHATPPLTPSKSRFPSYFPSEGGCDYDAPSQGPVYPSVEGYEITQLDDFYPDSTFVQDGRHMADKAETQTTFYGSHHRSRRVSRNNSDRSSVASRIVTTIDLDSDPTPLVSPISPPRRSRPTESRKSRSLSTPDEVCVSSSRHRVQKAISPGASRPKTRSPRTPHSTGGKRSVLIIS